jgi:hypothetical protein
MFVLIQHVTSCTSFTHPDVHTSGILCDPVSHMLHLKSCPIQQWSYLYTEHGACGGELKGNFHETAVQFDTFHNNYVFHN